MFLGHYAVAFAARRAAPDVSLGTTSLAAQLLDLLWPILLLLGIERVAIVPGLMRMNALDFLHYPISHSLLTAAAWGVAAGAIFYAARRRPRGAWIVGALVLSHWFLDVVMHRPDLPLYPGGSRVVGFGLWNSFTATVLIELGLFSAGLALYVRGTRPRDATGTWALVGLATFLLLIFLSGLNGAPPPSPRAVAIVTLGLWLIVPWSYWIDRHREPRLASSLDPARRGPLSPSPAGG